MLLPKDLSDPASALMYIPMSCDLGIHLVPAVAVIVGKSKFNPPCLPHPLSPSPFSCPIPN
jgi:hypothetical protein